MTNFSFRLNTSMIVFLVAGVVAGLSLQSAQADPEKAESPVEVILSRGRDSILTMIEQAKSQGRNDLAQRLAGFLNRRSENLLRSYHPLPSAKLISGNRRAEFLARAQGLRSRLAVANAELRALTNQQLTFAENFLAAEEALLLQLEQSPGRDGTALAVVIKQAGKALDNLQTPLERMIFEIDELQLQLVRTNESLGTDWIIDLEWSATELGVGGVMGWAASALFKTANVATEVGDAKISIVCYALSAVAGIASVGLVRSGGIDLGGWTLRKLASGLRSARLLFRAWRCGMALGSGEPPRLTLESGDQSIPNTEQ